MIYNFWNAFLLYPMNYAVFIISVIHYNYTFFVTVLAFYILENMYRMASGHQYRMFKRHSQQMIMIIIDDYNNDSYSYNRYGQHFKPRWAEWPVFIITMLVLSYVRYNS